MPSWLKTLSMGSRLRGNDVLAIRAHETKTRFVLRAARRVSHLHHFHAAHLVSALVVYACAPGIVAATL
jgi:hypothetical protein